MKRAIFIIMAILIIAVSAGLGIAYMGQQTSLKAEKQWVESVLKRKAPASIAEVKRTETMAEKLKEINAKLDDATELLKPAVTLFTMIGGTVLLVLNIRKASQEKKAKKSSRAS